MRSLSVLCNNPWWTWRSAPWTFRHGSVSWFEESEGGVALRATSAQGVSGFSTSELVRDEVR